MSATYASNVARAAGVDLANRVSSGTVMHEWAMLTPTNRWPQLGHVHRSGGDVIAADATLEPGPDADGLGEPARRPIPLRCTAQQWHLDRRRESGGVSRTGEYVPQVQAREFRGD